MVFFTKDNRCCPEGLEEPASLTDDINLQKKLEAMMHTLVNEYQIWRHSLFQNFLLASSRFLTIKTRGVLFDTLEVKQWKLKNGLENAMMSETHDAQKNSKMTTHQSAHFSSDNFSFNLAKIHKRGANKGRVYSIVQPTVLLQKVEVPPLKKHFLLKWKNCNEKLILLVRG